MGQVIVGYRVASEQQCPVYIDILAQRGGAIVTYVVDFFIGITSGICGNILSTYIIRYFNDKKKAQK